VNPLVLVEMLPLEGMLTHSLLGPLGSIEEMEEADKEVETPMKGEDHPLFLMRKKKMKEIPQLP